MHRLPIIAAIIAAGLLAGAAQAQDSEDDCSGACAAERHRALLDTFGLLPAEEHAEAGSELRRAMFVDDYGRPMVAVIFLRTPHSAPVMRVHFARQGTEPRMTPLEAAVPAGAWDEVIWRSEHFDRELVPEASPGLIICSHGWTFAVEAVDPPDGYQAATVRRKTENACDDGLAGAYALDLAEAAVALLPACELLDTHGRRDAVGQLHRCRMLSGDRVAAAEALNRAEQLRSLNSAPEAASARRLFEPAATLDWNGERRSGAAAAAYWIEQVTLETPASFFVDSIEGLTADRVRVTGFLNRSFHDPDFREERAPVEQVWTRRRPDAFRIESATVGPFQPVERDSAD